jgi:hypothetical protein
MGRKLIGKHPMNAAARPCRHRLVLLAVKNHT